MKGYPEANGVTFRHIANLAETAASAGQEHLRALLAALASHMHEWRTEDAASHILLEISTGVLVKGRSYATIPQGQFDVDRPKEMAECLASLWEQEGISRQIVASALETLREKHPQVFREAIMAMVGILEARRSDVSLLRKILGEVTHDRR